MSTSQSPPEERPPATEDLGVLLHSRSYLALLAAAALIGIPISLIAWTFLVAVHQLEHLVWDSLPHALGYDVPPAWWPVATLTVAGVLVALAVLRLPGHGGHVPAEGLTAGGNTPRALPGIVLASAASLVLGAVIGPEAPLIAIGGGVAVLITRWRKRASDGEATYVLAAAGSAAAISTIFGNPLIAAVMFLEVGGLARRKALLVILPCLTSGGVGALIFTGLGRWTGLGIGALAIPNLQMSPLAVADVLWAIPLAAVVALGTWGIVALGQRTARLAEHRTMTVTVGVGLIAGLCAALYSVATDRSPTEVALSGQGTLAALVTHPGQWSTGALVLLLVCKGLAYALCLGVFRGGQVFPAIFLGAAFGALAGAILPGLETSSAISIGMAAGVAITRLPVTSILLVVLLLGSSATGQMPIIILAAVTAFVVNELLSTRWVGSRSATTR